MFNQDYECFTTEGKKVNFGEYAIRNACKNRMYKFYALYCNEKLRLIADREIEECVSETVSVMYDYINRIDEYNSFYHMFCCMVWYGCERLIRSELGHTYKLVKVKDADGKIIDFKIVIRSESAHKRNEEGETFESYDLMQKEFTTENQAIFNLCMDSMDSELQCVASDYMEGYTNKEIGERLAECHVLREDTITSQAIGKKYKNMRKYFSAN